MHGLGVQIVGKLDEVGAGEDQDTNASGVHTRSTFSMVHPRKQKLPSSEKIPPPIHKINVLNKLNINSIYKLKY
jgi:hypothetical protein